MVTLWCVKPIKVRLIDSYRHQMTMFLILKRKLPPTPLLNQFNHLITNPINRMFGIKMRF